MEVVGFDKENNQFLIEDDGAGEIDSLTGNEGINRFVLGNNEESFYVGNGDEDYANIYDFDALTDSLIIAGDITDYNLETVAANEGQNLEISNEEGDLIAILHDVGDLSLAPRPQAPTRFPDGSVLVTIDSSSKQAAITLSRAVWVQTNSGLPMPRFLPLPI